MVTSEVYLLKIETTCTDSCVFLSVKIDTTFTLSEYSVVVDPESKISLREESVDFTFSVMEVIISEEASTVESLVTVIFVPVTVSTLNSVTTLLWMVGRFRTSKLLIEVSPLTGLK